MEITLPQVKLLGTLLNCFWKHSLGENMFLLGVGLASLAVLQNFVCMHAQVVALIFWFVNSVCETVGHKLVFYLCITPRYDVYLESLVGGWCSTSGIGARMVFIRST